MCGFYAAAIVTDITLCGKTVAEVRRTAGYNLRPLWSLECLMKARIVPPPYMQS